MLLKRTFFLFALVLALESQATAVTKVTKLMSPVKENCSFQPESASDYGMRPIHPVTRRRDIFHAGVDIVAPKRTPYLAPGDGEVIRIGPTKTSCGYIIEIKHSENLYSHSCHMDPNGYPKALMIGMKKNKKVYVKQGQLIAKIGTTGASTGPHAHFVVKTKPGEDPKDTIDPLTVMQAVCGVSRPGKGLDGADYVALEAKAHGRGPLSGHREASVGAK